ncbi:GL10048 [Drosophila persimilis]|uniref:GL10048 n=1 Tax=Drosophila persimilis TaxID=7234 RepID=B4HDJ3_DROPE|nr:GL10048 [Drosophila persimilis]
MAVNSAKQIVVRQIADASLAGSEVQTVLAEAEAIQISRPLTLDSTDPSDLIVQALHSLPQGYRRPTCRRMSVERSML